MQLRTFRGKTMADALSAVKRELGKDAVIVHTRAFKLGGVVGLGARNVVEIIAGAGGAGGSNAAEQVAAATSKAADKNDFEGVSLAEGWERPIKMRRAPIMGESRPSAPQTTSGAELLQVRKRRAAGLLANPDGGAARRVARLAADAVALPGRADAGAAGAEEGGVRSSLEVEVAEIRRMVEQVLRAQPTSPAQPPPGVASAATQVPGPTPSSRDAASPNAANLPEALFKQYLKLLEGEVTRELCDQIVAAVRAELTDEQLADEADVREAVLRQIAALIPVSQKAAAPTRGPDGRPRVIALVGPTGVGKTTTVAKLAAAYRLRHGRSVGLVTCDTYRIGAVDQLRTYASIIGVPLKVALTPEEMGDACRDLTTGGCDVVLIDTAGRSPSDEPRLDELRRFLDAARPHETHLVLSGVSSQAVMLHTAERFRAVGCDKVIFTKLDEAVHFGVLVNVARAIDAELSFVTTGQEVPDHIEAGRADRLARLVLEGTIT